MDLKYSTFNYDVLADMIKVYGNKFTRPNESDFTGKLVPCMDKRDSYEKTMIIVFVPGYFPYNTSMYPDFEKLGGISSIKLVSYVNAIDKDFFWDCQDDLKSRSTVSDYSMKILEQMKAISRKVIVFTNNHPLPNELANSDGISYAVEILKSLNNQFRPQ